MQLGTTSMRARDVLVTEACSRCTCMYEDTWFRGQSGTRLPPSIARASVRGVGYIYSFM